MSGVLILGAGGHGKVVADILVSAGFTIIAFLDDDPQTWNRDWHGIPIRGPIHTYLAYLPCRLALGIGSNAARRRVVEALGAAAGALWVKAIHPRAVVASSVQMGEGIVVAAGAVINPDTVLGNFVIVNTGATIDHDCQIADYVHIAPGSHLAGGVQVGQETLLGVGTNVGPYRSIGRRVTAGVGAAIVRDVPDEVVAKGVPARWDSPPQGD
jgi:sugar O-acyltransferase (sialic acid O-acetyltransferase NeuD family)